MTVTVQTERYLDVLGDAAELTKVHWEEIARDRDAVPLNVDHVAYAKLDERGQLLIVTARDAGRLIGYLTYFIQPQGHPHYLGTPWAESDVFFVVPEARKGGIGAGLITKAEEALRACGVKIMHTRTKNDHPTAGMLFQHMGHVPIETVHAKVLR